MEIKVGVPPLNPPGHASSPRPAFASARSSSPRPCKPTPYTGFLRAGTEACPQPPTSFHRLSAHHRSSPGPNSASSPFRSFPLRLLPRSVQVYKQKVKHLLYEHQNNITTLKADGELALKLQQDEFRKREGDLGKDKRNLKLELKEQVPYSGVGRERRRAGGHRRPVGLTCANGAISAEPNRSTWRQRQRSVSRTHLTLPS